MMIFPLLLALVHTLWFKFCTIRHKCYCTNFILHLQRFWPNVLESLTVLIKLSAAIREVYFSEQLHALCHVKMTLLIPQYRRS